MHTLLALFHKYAVFFCFILVAMITQGGQTGTAELECGLCVTAISMASVQMVVYYSLITQLQCSSENRNIGKI